MKRIAVISTNNNNDYLFYLPVVVEGWFKLGIDVFLLKTSDALLPYATMSILKYIGNCYPERRLLTTTIPDIEGVDSITVTQCSRLFAAYHLDKDYRIITSDIDMLVTKDIFDDKGLIDCHGRDLTDWHYPICYISMTRDRWIDVMGIDLHETFEANIKRTIKAEPWHNSAEWWQRWGTDQQIITRKLEAIKGFVFHHDRGTDELTGYPKGRLDRSGWNTPTGDIIDVHLPRNPLNEYNKIAPLCGDWFDNYFKSYGK